MTIFDLNLVGGLMKPYSRSIIELFDGKRRYLIPRYQRQYAWGVEPQLQLLWEDIERAVDRLETDRASVSPHFMGAIVIVQIKTFGKEVQAFEIIDGQQRLTTFQLLLCAIRDVAARYGSRYADEVNKYLLNDGVMDKPDVERFKLWPSLVDRRAFVSILDPGADLESIAPRPTGEDGYVRRAVLAHEYFLQQVEEHVEQGGQFDEHRLEILFEALKEGLAVVSIELEGGDDPQTIFETLNSRGIDLTAADLLRNFIFQRAKGLGQSSASLVIDKLYEKHWLPLDQAFWSHTASRGRQNRQRLDWMLTDHLSMHVGDLVSVEALFQTYRRWILNKRPFSSVIEELESITATEAVERRLFDQKKGDRLGEFGAFAEAFDVSTVMPLVLYLATSADVGSDLPRALSVLESYILRRDICGLNNKNYNRIFVGLVERLRTTEGNKVDALVADLSSRQSEIDRWPDDAEWAREWLGRDQYKGARQPRLRYIFEAIEKAKRTALNEDVEIKSALSIEHIMPQKWGGGWPLPGAEGLDESSVEYLTLAMERDTFIHKMGNLTLLTHSLNSQVSNGPYRIKMPAVRSQSSLALNRELNHYERWDEKTIRERGAALFTVARQIWSAPDRAEFTTLGGNAFAEALAKQQAGFPPDGTNCRFTYGGKTYFGRIDDQFLVVDGVAGSFPSFSAASRAITNTNRNGWNDWHLADHAGGWTLADDWRKQASN